MQSVFRLAEEITIANLITLVLDRVKLS
jgi:hypothetical protein